MKDSHLDKEYHLKVKDGIDGSSPFLCVSVEGFEDLWKVVVRELGTVFPSIIFKARIPPYTYPMCDVLSKAHGVNYLEGITVANIIRKGLKAQGEWEMTPRELISTMGITIGEKDAQ